MTLLYYFIISVDWKPGNGGQTHFWIIRDGRHDETSWPRQYSTIPAGPPPEDEQVFHQPNR